MTDQKSLLVKLFDEAGFPEDAFFIDKALHGRKLIVYGAGESFHYLKEVVMRFYGYIPSLVLDRRFASGDVFEGIPASSLEEYEPTDEELEHAVVVICLGNQTYFDDILQSLRQKGFLNVISLNDIYEIHNPFLLPRELDERGFDYYCRQKEAIESCLELFADELSREVYLALLQTHLLRKPVQIPMSSRHEQYTPSDVPLSRGHSRFIYCGVSVGELADVFGRTGSVEEVICFEPDPNQYRLTVEYLQKHHNRIAQRVTAVPSAVFDRVGIEPFTFSDTSFGSRILATGKDKIQTVTIDNMLYGFNPTFISMDIEGAEPEALRGAEHTIRENRPDLAVCVYHSPAHLWEVPLYLHSLNLGYRFYLRNYTSFVSETVLYATVSDQNNRKNS